MDLAEAQQFVRRKHHAVLTTRTAEGGIQQTPVLVGLDADGRFVVSSREAAFKTRNLRRDPWAQLCVMSDEFFGSWVLVEGKAEILSLPEAMEPLVDYYRALSGEHGDWEEYREAMRRDRRVLIRVTATRVGPDHEG
jgi:PPOX class probable F420-dependent enzyme